MPTFTWDVSPTLFKYPDWLWFLPGDGIRYYSLLYVCVFLGGYRLLDWQIRRAGGPEKDASDFVMYGVIAVLGGARMGHVFFYDFDKFKADPLWLFRIWEGGLASHGGTIGLLVGMWIFTKLRRQSFIEGCDRFAFSAALGATLIRIGNFMNSEIVGRGTDQTWGVRFVRHDGLEGCQDQELLPACLRHPSQLYEALMGVTILGALWLVDRALGKEKRPRGVLISTFFALYFTGRFIVEYWKDFQEWAVCIGSDVCPSTIVKGIKDMYLVHAQAPTALLTEGQLLSIIPAIAGFVGLYLSFKKRIPAHWNVIEMPSANDDADDESESDDSKADDDVDEVLIDKR
ncbi:MAG TPA: prolipoprotein diacylglyceryl transferase [Polyangiaceae bacterium]|nr:prolipoprotein diacylglyceryl transferase [Polyangiaceae bacterium]